MQQPLNNKGKPVKVLPRLCGGEYKFAGQTILPGNIKIDKFMCNVCSNIIALDPTEVSDDKCHQLLLPAFEAGLEQFVLVQWPESQKIAELSWVEECQVSNKGEPDMFVPLGRYKELRESENNKLE